MAKAERTAGGQFAEGNPGGPGRPRRATERAYLAALSDACPPETWREIVERAVADAKGGDAKARTWLASYLVGEPSSAASTLHRLAVEEASGADPLAAEVTGAEHRQELEAQLRAKGVRPGTDAWNMAVLMDSLGT